MEVALEMIVSMTVFCVKSKSGGKELEERERLDKMLREHVVTAHVLLKAWPSCWFPL